MKPLLLLLSVTLVACVGSTDPNVRDFNCLYPGDTVGFAAFHDENRVIVSCKFIVQKELECDPKIDSRILFHQNDCIVGKKI